MATCCGHGCTLEGHKGPHNAGATAPLEPPILRFFRYDHLPEHLQTHSMPFAALAVWITDHLPPSAERTVALRKLLEAKDAARTAALPEER